MLLTLSLVVTLADGVQPRQFAVPSRDGVVIHGQVDRPDLAASGAVVMVAGTGPFDRDVSFGAPGEAPARVFRDLSERLTARGVAVVRYDKRGVRYGRSGAERIDTAEIITATTSAMRDDLAAIDDWTRALDGLAARCVVLFGHSEGMVHIGRLAQAGRPAPAAVFGVGALLTDPVSNFRWNLAERDSWSLRAMDVDGDGVTTNDEVRANIPKTPAAVHGVIEPYLAPDGVWSSDDIAELDRRWAAAYPLLKAQMLAAPDEAPWPTAEAPSGAMEWAKSWYLDEQPVAANLARWSVPVFVHLGERDSQTHAPLQRAAGEEWLGDRLTLSVHAGVGHTLGAHPTYGPMQGDLADQIADEMVEALKGCSGSH